MSKIDTLLPAEITRISGDHVRKTAEKGVIQARDACDKFSASARDAAGSFDASAIVLVRGVSEFNAKAFSAFCANTGAAFDFLTSLAGAKSPAEIVALQSNFVEKQFKAMNEQASEFSALARRIAADCAEPIKGQLTKAFKPLA